MLCCRLGSKKQFVLALCALSGVGLQAIDPPGNLYEYYDVSPELPLLPLLGSPQATFGSSSMVLAPLMPVGPVPIETPPVVSTEVLLQMFSDLVPSSYKAADPLDAVSARGINPAVLVPADLSLATLLIAGAGDETTSRLGSHFNFVATDRATLFSGLLTWEAQQAPELSLATLGLGQHNMYALGAYLDRLHALDVDLRGVDWMTEGTQALIRDEAGTWLKAASSLAAELYFASSTAHKEPTRLAFVQAGQQAYPTAVPASWEGHGLFHTSLGYAADVAVLGAITRRTNSVISFLDRTEQDLLIQSRVARFFGGIAELDYLDAGDYHMAAFPVSGRGSRLLCIVPKAPSASYTQFQGNLYADLEAGKLAEWVGQLEPRVLEWRLPEWSASSEAAAVEPPQPPSEMRFRWQRDWPFTTPEKPVYRNQSSLIDLWNRDEPSSLAAVPEVWPTRAHTWLDWTLDATGLALDWVHRLEFYIDEAALEPAEDSRRFGSIGVVVEQGIGDWVGGLFLYIDDYNPLYAQEWISENWIARDANPRYPTSFPASDFVADRPFVIVVLDSDDHPQAVLGLQMPAPLSQEALDAVPEHVLEGRDTSLWLDGLYSFGADYIAENPHYERVDTYPGVVFWRHRELAAHPGTPPMTAAAFGALFGETFPDLPETQHEHIPAEQSAPVPSGSEELAEASASVPSTRLSYLDQAFYHSAHGWILSEAGLAAAGSALYLPQHGFYWVSAESYPYGYAFAAQQWQALP